MVIKLYGGLSTLKKEIIKAIVVGKIVFYALAAFPTVANSQGAISQPDMGQYALGMNAVPCGVNAKNERVATYLERYRMHLIDGQETITGISYHLLKKGEEPINLRGDISLLGSGELQLHFEENPFAYASGIEERGYFDWERDGAFDMSKAIPPNVESPVSCKDLDNLLKKE